MPGPYGVPQMGCGREGQGRAAALPFAVGGGYRSLFTAFSTPFQTR